MNKEKTKNIYIITVVVILVILVAVYIVLIKKPIQAPVQNIPTPTAITVETQQYVNTQYGFSISLPSTWKGYTVVAENWTGTMVDNSKSPSIQGPKLLIRHPLWTLENPRQDIPIMVFSKDQWNLIVNEKLSVGAAPIGPSELGRNANYIFALPARYNFAYATGFEEVQQIIYNKSFKAI